MRDSLCVSLPGKTLKRILNTSSGTEFLNFVFEVIYMVYFERIEHLKVYLKYTKLLESPGEMSPIAASRVGITTRGSTV